MLINQQVDTKAVPNPYPHLPSVTTEDMVQLMRIDKTMGSDRIAGYIADAYDVVNGQLSDVDFHTDNRLNNWLLRKYGGFMIDTSYHKQLWLRAYKRAVLNEAAALMADNYLDFDTTGNGMVRGENEQSKSDRLRRIVSHAIADMTGRRRNRISLM